MLLLSLIFSSELISDTNTRVLSVKKQQIYVLLEYLPAFVAEGLRLDSS